MQFIRLYAAAAVAFLITEVPVTEAWSFRTKRGDWEPSDPLAYEVPITFDSFGRFLAPIGMVRPQKKTLTLAKVANAAHIIFIRANLSLKQAISASSCPHLPLGRVWLRSIARTVPRR